MARTTGINWTTATWNPWRGCTIWSPGCHRCYAKAQVEAQSRGAIKWGKAGVGNRVRTATWADPPKWNREAQATGERIFVFTASLADIFDDHPDIQTAWRDEFWDLIRSCPSLTWLLLTKRPDNAYLPNDWGPEGWPNVWIGASVESQPFTDRIDHLLAIPAPVHFLSCEPLLGPVELAPWLGNTSDKVSWVICAGEKTSHDKADPSRRLHLAWAKKIRDDCAATGAHYWFKQWGNFDADGKLVGAKTAGDRLEDAQHRERPAPLTPVKIVSIKDTDSSRRLSVSSDDTKEVLQPPTRPGRKPVGDRPMTDDERRAKSRFDRAAKSVAKSDTKLLDQIIGRLRKVSDPRKREALRSAIRAATAPAYVSRTDPIAPQPRPKKKTRP
ncbi:DUF5131 family protein [Magnetospirillum gryphiswaldense]|uniref:Phage Gp37Gp68 n=1 Tax=Magnetospirillum gryphiswaldense TaxID=55518 RepID=A4U3H3_9PROT|nr:DUF5131 family protein [Magnetospirillum gryphiswaldense]AVM75769.1 Phage protein Gp37/Gp68 [Magnetospirillum gryphiswaldense MSR-1]AVM79672.1 Phage protein Gp37/Gp68 [Magnetospirillum gryphiswaldense]CAM77430.1 Phage Gp37Gp68 [Magnetospirillum gryphiswaldense MSR-1]